MKKILVINPGSTSTKIAFYHDGEQVWKESIEHDAAEIKKYTVIYDQKEMRTALGCRPLPITGKKSASFPAWWRAAACCPPIPIPKPAP